MSLQEELAAMIAAEEERLGVGSKEFMERHREIMEQIDGIMTRERRRKAMNKQYMTAAEVAEVVGVSLGKSYQLIREMNAELKADGYLTVSGKVPTAYFKKKYYGFEMIQEEQHC